MENTVLLLRLFSALCLCCPAPVANVWIRMASESAIGSCATRVVEYLALTPPFCLRDVLVRSFVC